MKVCIVGGGSSGWWTAAYLEKFNPDVEITLVESATVPRLGVGEGTLPGVVDFIRDLGIDETEWMTQACGTYKLGTARKGFVHKNECDFYETYLQDSKYAYHVDANRIWEVVKNSTTKVNHVIMDVTCIDDLPPADLYVDCTGLSRVLIKDKTLVKHPDLTLNTCIVRRAINEPVQMKTLTKIFAREYGWEFNVGLSDGRVGVGYVYDSNLVSDEDAKREYMSHNGHREFAVDFMKLQWEPGVLNNPWQDNVVAVGVSSGFVEPMEASGLAVLAYQIKCLSRALNMSNGDRFYRKAVERVNRRVMEVMWIVYAITQRDDTEFWRKWKDKDPSKLIQQRKDIQAGHDQSNFMFSDYLYQYLEDYGKISE